MDHTLTRDDVQAVDLASLDDLTAAATLTPLKFDATTYTPFEEFTAMLNERLLDVNAKGERRRVKVSNRVLSVKGRVVSDSMEKYLASSGLSSSSLKEALKTPLHFFFYQQKTFTLKNTAHFDLGTFVHSAFLEPRKFDRVAVMPSFDLRTNQGLCIAIKLYWTLLRMPADCILSELKQPALRDKLKQLEQLCDYAVISEQEAMIVDIVKRSFYSYGGGLLPRLLQNAKFEVSMYGTDAYSGQRVKIRPDAMLLAEDIGINAIVSLKTTSAVTLEAFIADAAKYRYELSEGMYLDVASQITGREFTATIMIMAQTVIPFQIAVFYWDAEDLQVGKYKYRQAIDIVAECADKKVYRGFEVKAAEGSHGIIQMKLPAWTKLELKPTYIEDNN